MTELSAYDLAHGDYLDEFDKLSLRYFECNCADTKIRDRLNAAGKNARPKTIYDCWKALEKYGCLAPGRIITPLGVEVCREIELAESEASRPDYAARALDRWLES